MEAHSTPREMDRIIEVRRKLLESIPAKTPSVITLKLLLDEIKEKTGETLGFNTLRRFFGMLPTGNPSYKTWRIFESYLKSTNMISNVQSNEFMTVWKTTHELNSMLTRSSTEEIVEYLLAHRSTDRLPHLLGTITNHYLALRNCDSLVRIYQENQLFADFIEFSDYLSEIVGVLLRKMNQSERDAFKPLFMLPNFKKSILYFFIDYEHLNGYYGNLLAQISPETNDEAVFLQCILKYRDYLGVRPSKFNPPIIDVNELKSMHPVLTGRYIGMVILEHSTDSMKIRDELLGPLAHVHRPHLLFLEIIPAVILTRNFGLLKWVFEEFYEELYELEHWFGYLTLNLYLIAESILYLSENDLRRSQLVFDSIELHKTSVAYSFYINLFFTIPEYHISKRIGKTQIELDNLCSAHDIACKHAGFQRMAKPFVEGYFEEKVLP